AFPSIYRTDAHPLASLLHSGRWQIVWVTLFGVAAAAKFVASPYASTFLALASIAMIATAIKCLLHGLRSDVASLPPIGPLSRPASRLLYRMTIAGFHFLQPFARAYGRVRGAVSKPVWRRKRSTSQATARAPLIRGARLLFCREAEHTFWSESWIDARA